MQRLETIILVAFLLGTLWVGGYTMYQINTTDWVGITKTLVK